MESFTVEKTWEALAYLLSKPHRDWMNYEEDEQDQGAVPDLMLSAINGVGGEVIGTVDGVMYFVLLPKTVQKIDTELNSIDLAKLRANYNPAKMDDAKVYPRATGTGTRSQTAAPKAGSVPRCFVIMNARQGCSLSKQNR